MAAITKRGKSWYARVRVKGIGISKSFQTKGQASAWATKIESEILSGTYNSGSEKTFIDAVNRYIEEEIPKKKSAKTELAILNNFKKLPFSNLKVDEISTEMIAQYRDTEIKRLKPASVVRYLGLMSALFETMRREWQWIKNNPVRDVKKPNSNFSRDRVFNDNEVKKILDVLGHNGPSTKIQQTIGDVFIFAIETAMRAGEILSLEWDRVDTNKRVATLLVTKNGDKREVPLSQSAIDILNRRLDEKRPFDLKPQTLAVMFPIYCKRAGVDGVNFHDTRHTAITRLVKKLSPFELARMVGHRNMSQTLTYYNESAENLATKLD